MVKISGLEDLSRFMLPDTKVYNTVKLVLGEEVIEVSGPVISRASPVLEELVKSKPELYLDNFTGEREGVQSAVQLIYGGDVDITEDNIRIILKFASQFRVEKMYSLGQAWVKENLSVENLSCMIELALVIQDDHACVTLADICRAFIRDHVKDDLLKVCETWPLDNNADMIKFMIQGDILYNSLPVLKMCISNDENVRIVIEELEKKDLVKEIPNHGARGTELLETMIGNVSVIETSKKLHTVQMMISSSANKASSSCSTTTQDLAALLSMEYEIFPLKRVLGLQQEFDLDCFQYVDVVLAWIRAYTQRLSTIQQLYDDVKKLYRRLNNGTLTYKLDDSLTFSIDDVFAKSGTGEYPPILGIKAADRAKDYFDAEWELDGFSENGKQALLNTQNVELREHCYVCDTFFEVRLQLVDRQPCFLIDTESHCRVKYWYLKSGSDLVQDYYSCSIHKSLVTNKYQPDLLRNYHNLLDQEISGMILCCVYECGGKIQKKDIERKRRQSGDSTDPKGKEKKTKR